MPDGTLLRTQDKSTWTHGSQTMNAVTNPGLRPDEAPTSALSALVDGELSSDELDAVLASLAEPDDGLQTWSRYQLIGDVLRGSAPVAPARSPQDFLAAIRVQLQASAPLVAVPPLVSPPFAQTQAGLSTAAIEHTVLRDAPAANDAVFRWEMVAGLASLAAVMAVSWTLLVTAPASPGGQGGGAQLALVSAPLSGAGTTTGQDRAEPVVVNTAQGPVLRDPQLEALMAQHRRYGDMSALQMPSGFLRNATHDAPTR